MNELFNAFRLNEQSDLKKKIPAFQDKLPYKKFEENNYLT